MTHDELAAELNKLQHQFDALAGMVATLGADSVADGQAKIAAKARDLMHNSGITISDLANTTFNVGGDFGQTIVKANTGITAVGPNAQAGGVRTGDLRDIVSSIIINAAGNVEIGNVEIHFTAPDVRAERAKAILDAYLYHQYKAARTLRLEKIIPRDLSGEPVTLGQVYVDLFTTLEIPDNRTLRDYLRKGDDGEGRRKYRIVSVIETLSAHRVTALLGAPGSGKTTLGLYLTLALTEELLNLGEGVKRLGEDWDAGVLLPIPVVLRQFAETLDPAKEGRAGMLWDFLSAEWQAQGHDPQTAAVLREVAAQRGALFLFDGLDEAGDDLRRQRVVEAVAEFVQNAGERSRFLLTSRPYAWDDGLWPKQYGALPVYRLRNFMFAQITIFIERWYAALPATGWQGGDAREAERLRDTLQDSITRADLWPLAEIPLLLTLTAMFQATTGAIPDDRVDLYEELVKLMLERWQQAGPRNELSPLRQLNVVPTDVRTRLEKVAFDAHAENVGAEGAADIPQQAITDALEPLVGGADNAKKVLHFIDARAGLLIGQGRKQGVSYFAFPHRTFQEFLASCHLRNRPEYRKEAKALAIAAPGHWREVLRMAARKAGPDMGVSASDYLIGTRECPPDHHPDEREWQLATLAAEQLLELRVKNVEANDDNRPVLHRVRGWLAQTVMYGAIPAKQRAAAGDTLAELGDLRPGVGLLPDGLPDIRWCYVPGGPFVMGSNERHDEGPQHTNTLLAEGYWMAQYPVTVGQWKAFCTLSGHKSRDDRSKGDPDNRPVRYVTWYEALKFAQWLDAEYRTRGWLPRGYRLTLPSEAEWEKAARGGLKLPNTALPPMNGAGLAGGVPQVAGWMDSPNPERRYPWGNDITPEHANYDKTGIGTTSAVGAFAGQGVSPYGCLDLSGNVWEWTRSLYQPYEPQQGYDRPEQREVFDAAKVGEGRLAVRGGSWYYNQFDARCAYRLRFTPVDFFFNNLGFRLHALGP